MTVTFIYPAVGRFKGSNYIRSWQMQPLAIAALAFLTPDSWNRHFFDDRLEQIDYDQPTDLVAISIETFTARRGYQIAAEYRKRGVPVVMGGYHATFCPEEVLLHADAVCVGAAEGVWLRILSELQNGTMKGQYQHAGREPEFTGFDRSLFAEKNYFKIALVETGRGCHFRCSFCSITAFHEGKCRHRPITQVVDEIKRLQEKTVFLVDDNLVADLSRAQELFTALGNLHIKWVGQASINVAEHPAMLDLMAKSGCAGLLIGFESLDHNALACVNKMVNQSVDYSGALAELRKRGIVIYGTFLLGLPTDTEQTARQLTAFAIKERLFVAAFNHIVPFPGTPLYEELRKSGRLLYEDWWLNKDYRFGDAPFTPLCCSSTTLKDWCHASRSRFYALTSIAKRALDIQSNLSTTRKTGLYFGLNFLLRKEIAQKRGLPLGIQDQSD